MEGVDRENSFSTGMAQPDGNWNRGTVVQEGENLALMTWKEERKSLMSPNEIEWHYMAIGRSIPHKRVSKSALTVCLVCLYLPILTIFLHLYCPRRFQLRSLAITLNLKKRTQTTVSRQILRQN